MKGTVSYRRPYRTTIDRKQLRAEKRERKEMTKGKERKARRSVYQEQQRCLPQNCREWKGRETTANIDIV